MTRDRFDVMVAALRGKRLPAQRGAPGRVIRAPDEVDDEPETTETLHAIDDAAPPRPRTQPHRPTKERRNER